MVTILMSRDYFVSNNMLIVLRVPVMPFVFCMYEFHIYPKELISHFSSIDIQKW